MENKMSNKERWIDLHKHAIINDERLEPTEAIQKILNDKNKGFASEKNIVLEIGCGFGRNIKYLLDNHYSDKIIGIDQTLEVVSRAQTVLRNYIEDGKCLLYIMDAGKKIDMPDNSIDIVFDIMSAITFIIDEDDRKRYWTEIKRILKPKGIFYFLTVRAEGKILDSVEGSNDVNTGTFQRKFDGMKEKSYSEEEISSFTEGFEKKELSILSNHYRAFGDREFVRIDGFWFGAFVKR